MGCVIHLNDDRHEQVSLLLPWYVAGRLDPVEHAAVEAHLAHCANCQTDLKFERRLDDTIADGVLAAEQGWARFKQRLDAPKPRAPLGLRFGNRARGGWSDGGAQPINRPWPRAIAGIAALQVATLAGLLWFALPLQGPSSYRVMGAGRAVAGDAIVMFREDITERQLRDFLAASNARIVDGPTSTNAYVLKFAAGTGPRGIETLKARPQVIMAEPFAASGAP